MEDRALVHGVVQSINVSAGGLPKHPVPEADVTPDGLVGDQHADTEHHGGPDRAVCIYSLERIEALRAEGHTLAPGHVGENLTVSGIDWEAIRPGVRLAVGDVLLEVTRFTTPCHKIEASFADGRSDRISHKLHPGWSRVYARVLEPGVVRVGDLAIVLPSRLD